MNFYSKHTLPVVEPQDIICYLSLWGIVIIFVVFLLGLGVGLFLFYLSYQNSSIWGMIFSALYSLLLWFVCNMAYFYLKATLSPSNWLARINHRGILLKYRSYLHENLPIEDPIALFLPWSDIVDAQLQKEVQITRDSDGVQRMSRWFFNIKVNLRYIDGEKIEQAFSFEHKRRPAHFKIQDLKHELFTARKNKAEPAEIERLKLAIEEETKRHPKNLKTSWHYHRPVTFVKPDNIRIEWSQISPSKKKTRQILSQYILFQNDKEQEFDLHQQMQDDKFNVLLASFIERGEKLDAIKLVSLQMGCNLAKAKELVEEKMKN